MLTLWIMFAVLLGITGFYFFLSVYIMLRVVSGYVLARPQMQRVAGKSYRATALEMKRQD